MAYDFSVSQAKLDNVYLSNANTASVDSLKTVGEMAINGHFNFNNVEIINKGILNSNNQIVQTINFTRTGVENIVSGQVTYGAWTGPSSFGAVTLPDIPGYTMTMS